MNHCIQYHNCISCVSEKVRGDNKASHPSQEIINLEETFLDMSTQNLAQRRTGSVNEKKEEEEII